VNLLPEDSIAEKALKVSVPAYDESDSQFITSYTGYWVELPTFFSPS